MAVSTQPARLSIPSALSAPVSAALLPFDSVILDEMENVALLNRVDTKFLLSEADLVTILGRVNSYYRVLTINGVRAGHYASLYFDTPDYRMYLDHHNGLRDRFKVRVRQYVDSGVAFLEVKRKTNRERTLKTRIPVRPDLMSLLGAEGGFVESETPYRAHMLHPGLSNSFARTTLVGRELSERVTLDFGLRLALGDAEVLLPGLVIAEVKQPKFTTDSPFVRGLRALHIEPRSFSKYCMGLVLLEPHLKSNTFKVHRLFLEQLLAGRRTHARIAE